MNGKSQKVELLEERIMVLTIALDKVKALAEHDPRIASLCVVALDEAGDEDYYSG